MENRFITPRINFPAFPFIYAYIESSYNKVTDYESFTMFLHGCLNEAERTTNEVKKIALNNIAKALYGQDTGHSYESKAIELKYNLI